ncbi:A-kinase anchor protein 17B-like isoform X2 [Hemicordylus capensis]|uniref:A-kinase anchor protein 17B-like isoform X2 n=1 Tax=Hemicordylus capensis TaxID=884348 RepID=UPI002302EC24|nr:A-kinase anchor protein 17B-like isoform X2 [Hemicordylus capensis]
MGSPGSHQPDLGQGGNLDTMTITLVCDPSEAMELCASQRLYLKPVAKLTISVVLPEHTGPTWAFSKWEVMDKLKNMVCPDQFTSVKVSKSTKGFIRFEGEAETKRLVCSLKEKLHGKMIKLNGFKDDLQVVATEEPPDFPASQELEPILNDGELLDEDFAEQSRAVPGCIHLEGLPCKWFALKGSDSETPSEDVLRAVFESFGKIKNVDIPMLDPYREEMMGGNVNNFTFRGLRTFEAYVQYQEPTAFAKAMETLKGMKLMFKGDDGKALACNIKVTSDTTDHFSESAINQRHLERLTLQGLERERKREENRGKKGTERKRRDDDDEKKVGEGKRKSKLKRREKRQIDRDEKRPRKQQKVTAGEELWPENMPEWEERKYLLAQRRVESIRLLTVLLSQIKDFVLSSRQIGEPLLDCEHEREDCFSAPQIQNALKEKTDSHYLRSQELKDKRESKCQSAQLDNTHLSGEDEEEDDDDNDGAVDLSTSPRPLTRTVLNKSAARTITSCSTDKDCCHSLLRVTVTQDCPALKPAREDYPSLNLGYCHKVSNTGNCRKQKVYETEEFIHYLLNYYQTPRYARVCPGMQSTAPESWWQRVVIDDGNCFQVNLKNKDGPCVTEVRFASNLQEGESRDDDDDDDKWEVIEEETEPTEVVLKSQAGTRELTKTCPVQWGDYSLSKASNRVPCDESDSPFLLSISTAYDKKPHQENTGMAIVPSHKAFGRMYKLKDLLEEISSDSEYFSEASESQSKMDKRNGGCRSSCKAWPLNRQRARELLICVQNVARSDQHGEGSKRSFCSSLECCDPTKHPGQSLKTTFKRSSSKIGHEGHKTKWLSSEEERETGKKRKKKKKRSSGDPLPNNEPHFFKTNHCGELESLGKMQRKCSKMLHHKMKCKKLHATTRGVKAKDAMHLGASQFQEAHQEAGGLRLRREAEADSEGWPLFPVELVQTSPYPESICGAELRRGC